MYLDSDKDSEWKALRRKRHKSRKEARRLELRDLQTMCQVAALELATLDETPGDIDHEQMVREHCVRRLQVGGWDGIDVHQAPTGEVAVALWRTARYIGRVMEGQVADPLDRNQLPGQARLPLTSP